MSPVWPLALRLQWAMRVTVWGRGGVVAYTTRICQGPCVGSNAPPEGVGPNARPAAGVTFLSVSWLTLSDYRGSSVANSEIRMAATAASLRLLGAQIPICIFVSLMGVELAVGRLVATARYVGVRHPQLPRHEIETQLVAETSSL